MPGGESVLAVDVGTSSVRAVVHDAEGEFVAASRHERGAGAGTRFGADVLWSQVEATIVGLPRGARDAVGSICIAAHLGTVFVDSDLVPLLPGAGWADSSGIDRLVEAVGDDLAGVLALTGRPAATGGALAASLALRFDDPRRFALVRHVLSPKDFLNAKLTGLAATDHTSAAYTGASDVAARRWSPEVLRLTGLAADWFPRQQAATEVLDLLHGPVARRLGLPPDAVVVTGGPDGTTGATAILEGLPESIADISGTTDAIVRVVPSPADRVDRAVLNPYPLGERWTVGGPTGSTGGAIAYWAALLGVRMHDLGSTIATVPAGAGGVRVSSPLSGSRFPRWDSSARGGIQHLGEEHGAPHLLRAVVEDTGYVVREGLDLLDPRRELPVVIAGGHARSPEAAQLRADIWGRPVHVSREPDVTLRGAVLIGRRGRGPGALRPDELVAYEPRGGQAAVYDDLYGAWLAGPGPSDPLG